MNKYRFLYFLLDANNLSYYIKNGVVAKSSMPVPLEFTPDGYKDQVLNFTRNSTYYSVFRSFTIPLRFVVGGARILRELLYKKGYEEVVYLVVVRENTETGRHEAFYKGEIDYSKYEDSLNFFEVNASEGGLTKFIKAFESTNFEIPLTGSNVRSLSIEGLELQKKFVFAVVDQLVPSPFGNVGLAYAYEEGTSFNVLSGTSPYDLSSYNPATDDDRWIIKMLPESPPVTFTVTGTFIITSNNTSQISISIETSTGQLIALVPTNTKAPGTLTYTVNASFTLQPNEKAFIIAASGGGTFEKSDISITFGSKYKQTQAQIINLEELGDRLIKQMAGSEYSLSSPLLRNCGIYATCGDALRGFATAKIKTTFKDYFTNVNRNVNVGLSIKDKTVYIKAKKDYYTTNVIYSLGLVKNAKFNLAEEFIFNNLKIGYPDETYDDVNGRDEFNQTQEYKTDITRISKTLDLTGNWKAGPYAIEFARINLQGKTTTDASSDNDNFLIDVDIQNIVATITAIITSSPVKGLLVQTVDLADQFIAGKVFSFNGSLYNSGTYTIVSVVPDITGGFFVETVEQTFGETFSGTVTFSNATLRRKTYDSITGVINPLNQFNIELSPKRLVNIHADELRSMLWMQDTKKLTFQTTNKNAELKTVLGNVTIEEKADVDISKLGKAYFIPILAKIEVIVPDALSTIMEANSTGVFSFDYLDETFKGYCIEAKQKPSDDEAQEWTLLLSSDNNIEKLIH